MTIKNVHDYKIGSYKQRFDYGPLLWTHHTMQILYDRISTSTSWCFYAT